MSDFWALAGGRVTLPGPARGPWPPEPGVSMPEETRRTAPRLDPRSPLVLDVRELGRRPGSMRPLSRSVPAPAHLGLGVLGVPEGSDLELDLRLESVVEGVLVSGTVAATVTGECVRCLDPVTSSIDVDLQELYVHPDREHGGHAGHHGRGRVDDGFAEDEEMAALPQLHGDLLDLEPVLRDAVVLALPLRPLCREDCPGLCSECGARLDSDPGHGHEVEDPRWAVLRQLGTD